MRKIMVRLCSILALLALIFSLNSIQVLANNENREPSTKMTYIDLYNATIDKGIISTTVTAKITGKSNVTSIKIKMELQKLTSGTYSTIQTWEQTFSGNTGTMEKSKTTSLLSTYRLKVTFTAYCGTASETKTLYVNE